MKFYDIDKLAEKNGITNKYLLTSMVSIRARQISESKLRLLEDGKEKYISLALEDIDKARIMILDTEKSFEERGSGEETDVKLEE